MAGQLERVAWYGDDFACCYREKSVVFPGAGGRSLETGNKNGDYHGGVVLKKTRSCENPVVNCALRVSNLCRWLLTDAVVGTPFMSEPDNSGLDQTSSWDSCLNLTTVDWTRPGDLKSQEEYQLTVVMILNPTRPDVRVLRNLVTVNFSPVQTSKSDDLKTRLLSKLDQMRAEKTGGLEGWWNEEILQMRTRRLDCHGRIRT
ncbi:hypothetical protein Bbelb_042260 [Branchiostoma belcheri]|nr:hypothetical protein Bbelb_042260 [Branchiostoma belcheri]